MHPATPILTEIGKRIQARLIEVRGRIDYQDDGNAYGRYYRPPPYFPGEIGGIGYTSLAAACYRINPTASERLAAWAEACEIYASASAKARLAGPVLRKVMAPIELAELEDHRSASVMAQFLAFCCLDSPHVMVNGRIEVRLPGGKMAIDSTGIEWGARRYRLRRPLPVFQAARQLPGMPRHCRPAFAALHRFLAATADWIPRNLLTAVFSAAHHVGLEGQHALEQWFDPIKTDEPSNNELEQLMDFNAQLR